MKVNIKAGYNRITSFLARNKWLYISGIFLIFVVNLLQLAIPRITGLIVDMIAEGEIEKNGLLGFSGLIILISLFIYGFSYIFRLQIRGAANLYDYAVRNSMFRHIENLSMSFFNRKGVGDIMALSINDLRAIRMALGRGMIIVANTVFILVSSIIIMGKTMDLQLTVVVFAPFPILVIIMSRFAINQTLSPTGSITANHANCL